MKVTMQYWLMKSEPSVFGIDDLARCKRQTEPWDGVRNYQARNMMRDEMQVGDGVFFYHSNCEVPGIVGIMRVVHAGYPDPTAFDKKHRYYDPKSDQEDPRWYLVDVQLERRFTETIELSELRRHARLASMKILQKGNRLSITPVTPAQWKFILKLDAS
jgi:predicted RNA-binding protein with PUA-like domain